MLFIIIYLPKGCKNKERVQRTFSLHPLLQFKEVVEAEAMYNSSPYTGKVVTNNFGNMQLLSSH